MTGFYLITGFLGSGKTTFLENILNEFSGRKRIAVIQNEFAPSGIDGKELKNTGKDFKLVEINNGSVFCVCLLGNFISTLENLLQNYKPDLIFLEASGLADPVNIIELLQAENIHDKINLAGIISIADAPNFERGLKTLTRFRHQLMIADLVIINKKDLFDKDIRIIREEVKTLNPYAEIEETSYCRIPLEHFFTGQYAGHEAAGKLKGMISEGRPAIKTAVLRLNSLISRKNLNSFLDEIQADCERIKGYVNLDDKSVVAIQTVFDQREIKKIENYTGPTELITFSGNMDVKRLRAVFKKYV